MALRAAVFCNNGLGDGFIGLVLSNNLFLNGWAVDTYNNGIGSMQNWFPHLPILSYPSLNSMEDLFCKYDRFFVVQNSVSDFIQTLIREGKKRFPSQIKVIYAYPSKNIIHEPYYNDSCICPSRPFAESLRNMCENILQLPQTTRSNGFTPPSDSSFRSHSHRVVIHPTSSRVGKNWSREKFVALAERLEDEGYSISWILGPSEREEWYKMGPFIGDAPTFPNLDSLANHVYESGYFIGNDSGIGHLASFLEIPTLSIMRSARLSRLWAPSYGMGMTISPPRWIPNIRGARIRDLHWKKFISTRRVLKCFRRLVHRSKSF